MMSSEGYQPIEWIRHQVWNPHKNIPETQKTKGILYFPDPTIEISEVHEAIEIVKPYIVVPTEGDTFERGTMYAHMVRNDPAYHTGILVPGMWDELAKHIKWAVARGFEPIVLRPTNFYGGTGTQDKDLWQMHQQGVWIPGAWYHLATSRPHSLHLPGRWTVGGDFVGLGQ
jgi:hypothetical protein